MPPYVRITKHLYSCIKHILRNEKFLSYKKKYNISKVPLKHMEFE